MKKPHFFVWSGKWYCLENNFLRRGNLQAGMYIGTHGWGETPAKAFWLYEYHVGVAGRMVISIAEHVAKHNTAYAALLTRSPHV